VQESPSPRCHSIGLKHKLRIKGAYQSRGLGLIDAIRHRFKHLNVVNLFSRSIQVVFYARQWLGINAEKPPARGFTLGYLAN